MSINIDDIKKLADLAKIEISKEEEEKYLNDINGVLKHLSLISEAKVDDSVNDFVFYNNTREDILRRDENGNDESFSKDIIFANIPSKSSDNYVKVSKVINKGK